MRKSLSSTTRAGKPGKTRELRHHPGTLAGRHRRALKQRRRILRPHERRGLRPAPWASRLAGRAATSGESAPRPCTPARKPGRPNRPTGQRSRGAGHEDQSAEAHAVARMQVMRQSGGAEDAVTLAANVFRRKPSLVPRGPEPNELAHRLDVGRFRRRTARPCPSSAGRLKPVATGSMNTKSVTCRIENSLSTRPNGAGCAASFSLNFTRLGPSAAEMQPHGCRPRTAVEAKRHRPSLHAALALLHVSDVEDRRPDSAVGFQQRQHPGLGDVARRAGRRSSPLFCEDRFLLGVRDRAGRRLRFLLLGGFFVLAADVRF